MRTVVLAAGFFVVSLVPQVSWAWEEFDPDVGAHGVGTPFAIARADGVGSPKYNRGLHGTGTQFAYERSHGHIVDPGPYPWRDLVGTRLKAPNDRPPPYVMPRFHAEWAARAAAERKWRDADGSPRPYVMPYLRRGAPQARR